ncbi:hypothetical protein BC941DRAFT_518335 [Chlamydoabsidia padenii]|nr:hypothetical protein BC941DRAFT_518335 [Chlamydoabsidia padenii]
MLVRMLDGWSTGVSLIEKSTTDMDNQSINSNNNSVPPHLNTIYSVVYKQSSKGTKRIDKLVLQLTKCDKRFLIQLVQLDGIGLRLAQSYRRQRKERGTLTYSCDALNTGTTNAVILGRWGTKMVVGLQQYQQKPVFVVPQSETILPSEL